MEREGGGVQLEVVKISVDREMVQREWYWSKKVWCKRFCEKRMSNNDEWQRGSCYWYTET